MSKMQLHLFSDVEGRVPMGAHQRFLTQLINEFFSRRALDVSAFLGQPPSSLIVWGDEATIHALTQKIGGQL